MLPRERQLAAVGRRVPDRIPVDAIHVENMAAIAAHLGIADADVPDRLGLDGRIVSVGYTGEVPGQDRGLNEWGSEAFDDYGTGHVFPLAAAGSIAAVERHAWPDPARYDYAGAADRARAAASTYAVRGPYWVPVFCQACSLMGMEEALAALMLEPVVFEAVIERVAAHVEELCRRFLAAAGDAVDILCIGDDFATQRGLLMRPELWRRHLKPRLARIFAVGHAAGKPVWFHSCGDITAVLPDLVDIGMDVWETVQLHALPLSARDLKREYGRHIAFFGGVNTQRLPWATPAEVADEVRRCIEALGGGGGYICGPDHHVKPDVSAGTTLALFDAATAFRGPGFTTA
ncbi:MAG TPA: uroporphyrinogen decarboxylase family protein [Desulfobacterales bacterium]|nr:uroporphyrinogen decarboxylase family protein [Desulfobacterales bacterium]